MVRRKLRRATQFMHDLFVPDYWDANPIHVAHRSLPATRAEVLDPEAGRGGGKVEEGEEVEVAAASGDEASSTTTTTTGGTPEEEAYNKAQDNWCTRLFLVMDEPGWNTASKLWAVFMSATIVLSCVCYVLGTMSHFKYHPEDCAYPVCEPGPTTACSHTICLPQPRPAIHVMETVTMIIFTVEYLVRVAIVHAVPARLVNPEDYVRGLLPPTEPSPVRKTVSYMMELMNLIDVAAVLPFYLHFVVDERVRANLVFLRLLRLLRVVRMFKFGRYTAEGSHAIIWETLVASTPALIIMLVFMLVLTVLCGALIFYAEEGTFTVTEEFPEGAYLRPSNAGGDEVSPFKNILMGAYWVIMTATTVGYGDISPTSSTGRVIAVVVAYSGIISIALPVTIIGKHFSDVYWGYWEGDSLMLAKLEAEKAAEAAEKACNVVARLDLGRNTLRQGNGVNLGPTSSARSQPVVCTTTTASADASPAAIPVATEGFAGTVPTAAAAALGAVGIRKRALTNIREELQRMQSTTQILMAQLEELESA